MTDQKLARVGVPFTVGGNENGCNGERMMVDPQNGNIIYMEPVCMTWRAARMRGGAGHG